MENGTLSYISNKHSSIGSETGEGECNMVVQHEYLLDCPGILQLSNSLSLHTQHNAVSSSNTNDGRSPLDSLDGVLYLEQVSIRREYSNSTVVRHFFVKILDEILIIYCQSVTVRQKQYIQSASKWTDSNGGSCKKKNCKNNCNNYIL